MTTRLCPRCGIECEAGLPTCPECGGYLGVRRKERVYVPAEKPPPEDTFGLPRPLYWFLSMFPGLASPTVIIVSAVMMVAAVMIVLLALMIFSLGAMVAAMMIGGVGLMCYWAAIAWLLNGHVCMLTDALVDFDGRQWTVFWLFTLLPLSLLFLVFGAVD